MQGLGETTAMLARLRKQAAAMSPPGAAGEEKLAETARFGRNPGALRMLSYVPAGLGADAPLVVVLHGCTQRGEAYADGAGWLTLADRHGFAVLVPEQTTANNFNRCFNWFEPEDAVRGKGEAASIRAMVAHMVKSHRIDPARIFITGLSAGGAMTSIMLAAYPEVFAGGSIVAGLPYGVADNVQEALGAMFGRSARANDLGAAMRKSMPTGGRLPSVSIWHGDSDHTVRPHNAVEVAAQWAEAHGLPAKPTELQRLPGRTRAVWRSVDGDVLLESNLISGMDHGAPVSTSGPEGAGRAGPFLLESDVSSSLEALRFWNLAPPPAARPAKPAAAPHRAGDLDQEPGRRRERGRPSIGAGVLNSVAGHVPEGVQSVIESALRKAGLMG